MNTSLDSVVSQALSLGAADRRELMARLQDRSAREIAQDLKDAWAQEAHDRLDAVRRGDLASFPGDPILRELDAGRIP